MHYTLRLYAYPPGEDMADISAILAQTEEVDTDRALALVRHRVPGTIARAGEYDTLASLQHKLLSRECVSVIEESVLGVDQVMVSRNVLYAMEDRLREAGRDNRSLSLLFVSATPDGGEQIPQTVHTLLRGDLNLVPGNLHYAAALNDLSFCLLMDRQEHGGRKQVEKLSRQAVESHFGSQAGLFFRWAHYPEDGEDAASLLRHAIARDPDSRAGGTVTGEEPVDDYIAYIFRYARGRQFAKLATLESEVLASCLARLGPRDKAEFLNRLSTTGGLDEEDLEGCGDRPALPRNKVRERILDRMNPAVFKREIELRTGFRKAIQEALGTSRSLATLPRIAMEVYEASMEKHISFANLAKTISKAPALASKLLQVVNSPFFNFSRKVLDIQQALVALGLNEVVDITLGLAISKQLAIPEHSAGLNPEHIWRHSVLTAAIAKHLFNARYPKNYLFTLGLLHDVGKMFLMEKFNEKYIYVHDISIRFNIPIYEIEDEIFGINHAEITAELFRSWSLPEELVESLSLHHHPYRDVSRDKLSHVVCLCDHFSNVIMPVKLYGTVNVIAELSQGSLRAMKQNIEGLSIPGLIDQARAILQNPKSQQLISVLEAAA